MKSLGMVRGLLGAGAVATAILALALPAAAQLYKYVDKNGKTVYSDTPPPGQDSKTFNVPSGTSAPQKSALQRDKELDKGRKQAAEAGKKADDVAKNTAKDEEACARARENYATLSAGGPVRKVDEKGERVFLDEQQIAAGLEKARRDIDELCKKS